MEGDSTTILPVPLSEVTLVASCKRIFDFMKNSLTTTGLLLATCQENIILRQSEHFPEPQKLTEFEKYDGFEKSFFTELFVLQCEPLKCGKLSLKTNIIIVCDTSTDVAKKSTDDNSQHLQDFPVLSDFLNVSSSFPRQKNQPLGLMLDTIILRKRTDFISKAKLSLHLNYDCFRKLVTRNDSVIPVDFDINNTVLLKKTFMQECGLFNGDWIQMASEENLHGDKSKSGGHKGQSTFDRRSSLLQVKAVEECDLEGSNNIPCFHGLPTVFSVLKINYDQIMAGEVGVCFLKYHSPTNATNTDTSVSAGAPPPYANELHLSCIQSPNYSASDNYAQLLQEFFSTPRLIKLNAVLPINAAGDPEYWQSVTEVSESRYPVVYFKITQTSKTAGSKAFLASTSYTTLYLDGTIQSFVPAMMSHVIPRGSTSSISPPGLEDYVSRILQLVVPYVQHKDKKNAVYPLTLLSGPSGCGKTGVVNALAAYLNMHCFQVNCHELCGETSGATEARIKHTLQRASTYAPCVLMLKNIDALGKDRDGSVEDPRVASSFYEQIVTLCNDQPAKYPVLIIASTSSPKHLSPDMQEGFLHHVEIETPNEAIRLRILGHILRETDVRKDVNLKHVAQRTAGMVLGDIQAFVCHVKKSALQRIVKYCKDALGHNTLSWSEEKAIADVGYSLCLEDFDKALDNLQSAHSDSLGAPKIPNIKWEDVGGLASVKSDILDTIQLPLQHPELFAAGLRRSGVLLYGPPGTGKTLLAKAVATECSLNFLSVKGPELINMYVGQSEENIREVFHRARTASPCVIFFDELDSLAPNRGRSGDSGGVMDRVVSQLLSELDGLHKSADVFVIGATNRPDLLDPALLRPGRFDKMLYLGVSEDRVAQIKIIEALTRKFKLDNNVSIEDIVSKCPFNLTGADFYALCSDAMLNALKHKIDQLELGETVDQSSVTVRLEDFYAAVDSLVPSVSEAELHHYKSVQQQFNMNKRDMY